MDAFLHWVIRQQYADFLARFMEIQTPTVHAFAKVVLESAIRIKSVQALNTLLKCGVKLDSMLDRIALIGDTSLTQRILFNADPACFKTGIGTTLFHHFVRKRQYKLAQFLLENGVFADAIWNRDTALFRAVGRKDIEGIKFLLAAGADVNRNIHIPHGPPTPLAYAVSLQYIEVVILLLEHGADISARLEGKPILEWAALNCRSFFGILKERLEPGATEFLLADVAGPGAGGSGFLLADVVDSAKRGGYALAAYIASRSEEVTAHQLERALEESILCNQLMAAMILLQHGVDPNCPTLGTRPLAIALRDRIDPSHGFVELLLEHKADVNKPGLVETLSATGRIDLLEMFLSHQIDLEQRMKALVIAAAKADDIVSVAMLLGSGLDIDTPELHRNPLQAVVAVGTYNIFGMLRFLIKKGANVNAPAHPKGGRTALQAALETELAFEIAEIFLRYGADASAAPALLDGVTALEACCHNSHDVLHTPELINKLLDAGATINRPGGKPSSVLHGIIVNGLHEVLSRFLEPRHNAIINYMWYDKDSNDFLRGPCTPTQLAASLGDLEALRILLDHGADINEAPAYRFGRTTLQAATLRRPEPAKMILIHFVLDHGADVNADAAIQCGITALQGAAVTGDLMLAELLLTRGADVNAWPSFKDGRTAIEAAAEHGRLDMVQLLLNAGATGDIVSRTNFNNAIGHAWLNGHFAIVNLLKKEQARLGFKVINHMSV